MIESNDAVKVVETIANNLIFIANNKQNFEKLPDTFWGYFARGHDSKNRKFAVIVILFRVYSSQIIDQEVRGGVKGGLVCEEKYIY